MNMFDEARAIKGMIEMCGMTQNQIASKMGVSQSYIANKLRLLTLSESIQKKITESGLSERHARATLRLKGDEEKSIAIDKALKMDLTVSAFEALVDNMLTDSLPKRIDLASPSERIESFERIISLSVENLRSYGINVQKRESVYEKKRYITLSIDER